MKAIYEIRNNKNGKIYVGSAQNLRKRWRSHRSDLNRGKHNNRYLQRAWDKNGEENFTFTVLEEVEKDEHLIPTEQKWLDLTRSYDQEIGYNILPTAGSPLGYKHSAEAKRKIAVANGGEKASAAKLTWEKVRQMRTIYDRDGITFAELGRQFGVSYHTVYDIINGRNWKNDPNGASYSPPAPHIAAFGESNGRAKLTWEKVRQMRITYARGGITVTELGRQFGVAPSTVTRVINRKTWINDPNERD